MRALILGGGFAGCTIANLLAKKDFSVTLLEKSDVLGGGCRTYFHGGHPFTYGPRVYYGYSDKVWSYLNSIVPMRRFPFELQTYVESEGRFFSYPIHEDDIPKMSQSDKIYVELEQADNSKEPSDFEEYWIAKVGQTLYDMFVNNYSKKMWMIESNKIFDIFKWSAKDAPLNSGTKEAYRGSYLGYPIEKEGYNRYFDVMVNHPNIKVVYNAHIADYRLEDKTVETQNGEIFSGDILISTIPIDELLDYRFGELPYAGRDFTVFTLPVAQAFPGDVRFCHYAGTEPFTRITEFKKITYYDSPDSVFVMEFPSKSNKLYPYLTNENTELADRYIQELPSDVLSIGRLGTYKYSTIEQTIVQAFAAYHKITGESINGMEGEFFGIGDTKLMSDRKESSGV